MQAKSQRPKGRDGVISSLNIAIEGLNLAKELANITPAKAVFGSASALLTLIKDTMVNKRDYVDLGLACADVCGALDHGVGGQRLDELSRSVCEAIGQLTTTMAAIQGRIVEKRERGLLSRLAHAKNDKETIATWRFDLIRILQVFNTELALNTHTIVSGMQQNMLKGSDDTRGGDKVAQTRVPGESPPSPPRIFFGRDELIEKIVDLADSLAPVALVGAGGIGKTSIALKVLHHDRIKQRFGENRRFIRCDQFPAAPAHFLARLSKAIGAGIESPENLAPLCPFISSREILIVLDNAESILDPQGANAQEIYTVVEELSRLETICLCITSRISTVPPDCETLSIPILSMKASRDTFYRIYKHGERSDLVNDILERLDFHPLSITLLATVAHHNQWSMDRLTKEWESQQTGVLQTKHNKSLAAAIELSLASPTFQELGPGARELLGVIAFFPQGVNENNIDWLLPTISTKANVFDGCCILSLTYRNNGFVTMLAPLRDYFCPKDPKLSPLLSATKGRYFSRLSVEVDPAIPGFEEARWILSEDVNVEHLLNVFTSIDAESDDVWNTCAHFMEHLCWHKPRLVMLGPKVERLRDDHPSKPQCLLKLATLFDFLGNSMEEKRLLTYSLKLHRDRADDREVAHTLRLLSGANRQLLFYKEGIQQAKEALGIRERLGDPVAQARCLKDLAWLLYEDSQLDAAEKAASHAIDLIPKNGDQFPVCESHRVLGHIYRSRRKTRKAIHHYETALGVASSFNWDTQLFWNHHSLAEVFFDEYRFDDAYIHIGRAKSHAANNAYYLGRATKLQATFLYRQRRFEEARSEALRAADVYEKIRAAKDVENCRELLRNIDMGVNNARKTG